jgi:hypothetical protein
MALSKKRKVGEYRPLGRLKFGFESVVRVYTGQADWYFAHLPQELSAEISELFADQKRGFGSLPVEVTIAEAVWTTSIFPDSSAKAYMLPLKAQIRKQVGIAAGDKVSISIVINV